MAKKTGFTLRDLFPGLYINQEDSLQRAEGAKNPRLNEQNIVRPTAEEQRVRREQAIQDRMAKARAAKAAKAANKQAARQASVETGGEVSMHDTFRRLELNRKAKLTHQMDLSAVKAVHVPKQPQSNGSPRAVAADSIKLPEHEGQRRVFLTLLLLAQDQLETGFTDRSGNVRYSPVVPHWKVLSETKGDNYGLQPDGEPYTARYILQDLERDGFVRQVISRQGTLSWVPAIFDENDPTVRGKNRGARSSDIRRNVEALETQYLNAAKRSR